MQIGGERSRESKGEAQMPVKCKNDSRMQSDNKVHTNLKYKIQNTYNIYW